MKKKTTKKLALERETVRELVAEKLGEVAGGKPETWTWRCPSNPTVC